MSPVGLEEVAGAAPPAFAPIAPELIVDCVVLEELLTAPVVVGMLPADCAVTGPCPAILFSFAALPVLRGTLEALSPGAGLAAAAVEAVVAPVVLDAWLLGLLLVALVCPLAGFVEFGAEAALLSELGEAGAGEFGLAAEPEGTVELPLDPELTPAFVGLLSLALFVEPPVLGFTVNCSFTCFTPAIDLAISLARFLSALAATDPVIVAVPFETDTCTLAKAGSCPNLD